MKTAKPVTKADILGASDLPVRAVDVPEWGGTVYLRSLTAGERFGFAASLDKDRTGAAPRLVALALADEKGQHLGLTDAELAKKSGAVVARLSDLIVDMNGLGAKGVDDAKKNS